MDATLQEQSSNPVGRPLKFKTPYELQEKIDEYFNYCDSKTKEGHSDKLGDMIMPDPEPYTMSGLAYWIGLTRQGLINYSNRDEFFDTIKMARQKVEMDVERRMNDKNLFTPGLIFNLKNNFEGWKDKQEIEETNVIQIDVNGMLLKAYGDPAPVIESTSIT